MSVGIVIPTHGERLESSKHLFAPSVSTVHEFLCISAQRAMVTHSLEDLETTNLRFGPTNVSTAPLKKHSNRRALLKLRT